MMHLSRRQLARKMKALSERTPLQFIQDQRLEKAKDLIREAKFSVEEVAQRVGYLSRSQFSKLFAERFGSSPAEWAKHQRD